MLSKDIIAMVDQIMSHIENEQVRQMAIQELPIISLCSHKEEIEKILDKLMGYEDAVESIRNNWHNIVNNYEKGYKLLSILGRDETIRKDILSDVLWLMQYSNCNDTGKIAKELYHMDGGKQAISNHYDGLLNYAYSHIDLITIPMLDNPQNINRIYDRWEKITSHTSEFFNIIRHMQDKEGYEKIYDEYHFWAELYQQICHPEDEKKEALPTIPPTDRMKIDCFFSEIINSDALEEKRMILEENAKEEPYHFKETGVYSLVLQSGDRIVKLGKHKQQFEVPYHPRIMMPQFRKKYEDESFLEVFDLGDVSPANITPEIALDIFKELEHDGIFWGDAKPENVVILRKDNVIPDYIKSEDFNVLGFLKDKQFPTKKHKPLKAGDFVICDLDFLFKAEDPHKQTGKMDPLIEKYIESQKKKAKKQQDIKEF